MAKKKADANKTRETTATTAAETETPVEQSEPVIEDKDAAGTNKKDADKTRRDTAIAEHQEALAAVPVDDKLAASDKIKSKLLAKMDELAAEVAEHDEEINALRDESAALLLELYPQQGENDKFAVAVRGYRNA